MVCRACVCLRYALSPALTRSVLSALSAKQRIRAREEFAHQSFEGGGVPRLVGRIQHDRQRARYREYYEPRRRSARVLPQVLLLRQRRHLHFGVHRRRRRPAAAHRRQVRASAAGGVHAGQRRGYRETRAAAARGAQRGRGGRHARGKSVVPRTALPAKPLRGTCCVYGLPAGSADLSKSS